MPQYPKKHNKKYKLGCKPVNVLKKQLERTLIKDIEEMKNEINELVLKKNLYIECKKLRILYDEQVFKLLAPLEKNKESLLNENSNYKKGIIYFLLGKVLKDDIKLEIDNIQNKIKTNLEIINETFNLKNSPISVHGMRVFEIDRLIQYEIESKINKYNNSIIVYQNEIELKQNKNQQIENIKGIAARSLNKTRQIANKIKINMEINNNCPYCEQPIVEVHVDHIFPVAKGGLSTTKNMVRVCSKCNIKKKDLTLNQFIKKYNLNRNLIESNLEALNKIY
jgi:5-methylcytosine-specific restriction endonuclease McrA